MTPPIGRIEEKDQPYTLTKEEVAILFPPRCSFYDPKTYTTVESLSGLSKSQLDEMHDGLHIEHAIPSKRRHNDDSFQRAIWILEDLMTTATDDAKEEDRRPLDASVFNLLAFARAGGVVGDPEHITEGMLA